MTRLGRLVRIWIVLSAILLVGLPAPDFAQPLQPGWIADAKTGCRIWNPRPKPNESVTWSGACQSGLAQGRGVEQWFESGQPANRIEGELRDGKLSRGIAIYPNGDRYDGEFLDGRRNGRGVYTSANGDRYEGEWRDDRRNGRGVYNSANGNRYEGEWRDGELLRALARHEIPLRKEAGVLVVPVSVNNTLTLEFTLDSGAADVVIPADVVLTLFRAKTLTEADFLGQRVYTLADGSNIPSQIFRIRSLKVGDLEIRNVIGNVGAVEGIPLLGQSFLSRLGRWSIDNQRQVLVIEDRQAR
jgi:hypothetical protein